MQLAIQAAGYPARKDSAKAAVTFHRGRQSRRSAASSIPQNARGIHVIAPTTPGCNTWYTMYPVPAKTDAPRMLGNLPLLPRSHKKHKRKANHTCRKVNASMALKG